MKKVIGIFITMVMVFVLVGMALGDSEGIAYRTNEYEAEELVKNWADSEGLYDWTTFNNVDGVLYYVGGVKLEYFKEYYGVDWSIQNFNEQSMKEWEISEIHTWRVGETSEGVAIYRTIAHSDSKVIAYYDEADYYNCDVLFIVYSEYEGGME